MQKQTKQSRQQPLVSVVMPVYNAAPYLVAAIESILQQTYKHIEFIIVDDQSTDISWEILKAYAKKYPQIKIFRNRTNQKSALTVNKAIAKTTGTFIARMDADDIALPNRLEKQVTYLLSHPATVVVGGQCILIDKNGDRIGEKTFPLTHEEIYKYIFQFCPAQQPTLMIAKDRLPQAFKYYDHGMTPVEDVELLFKFFPHGKVENLPDVLLQYRIHGKNSSLINVKKSFFLTLISRIRGVLFYGYRPTLAGVLFTIAQTLVVMIFPTRFLLMLYTIMRKDFFAKTLAGPLNRFSLRLAELRV